MLRSTHLNNVIDHVALEEVAPQAARELGEPEAEGEQEGQPEVVGGDRGVGRRRNLGLVHEASCGLALQMVSYVSCAVDPAVGPENEELIILFLIAVFFSNLQVSSI